MEIRYKLFFYNKYTFLKTQKKEPNFWSEVKLFLYTFSEDMDLKCWNNSTVVRIFNEFFCIIRC